MDESTTEDGLAEKPTAPETETYEKTGTDPDDGTEIHFEFEANPETGRIHWSAEWDGGSTSGRTSRMSESKSAILYRGARINGEKTAGSKLEPEIFEALQDDLEAVQNYRNDLRDWEDQKERRKDLTLTVTEISWESGTHRTKYTRRARVLSPNKAQRHWTDDEQDAMDALGRALGEANDLPKAEADEDKTNPFDDIEEETEFSLDEAVDLADADDDVQVVADEREREAALSELRDEHPELHGVEVDPQDVRDFFEEAEETGEPVEVASGNSRCSDRSKECDLDLLTYRATPEGEIDVKRTHTY
jgi:hypothetical protein